MHSVNMFAKQGMDRSTRTPTVSQVRAARTQREPTGRATIVIVTEREEKREREERRERERRQREGRRDERKRGRGMERERREPPSSLCAGSKRLRV